MAGVGFEINKILQRQSFTSVMQAYGYAAVIGSGPWLASVVSLALLGAILTGVGLTEGLRIFFVTVSLTYAITLVLTGPIQMVLTRFAADQEYSHTAEQIFPTFVFVLAWGSLGFAILGMILFLGCVEAPLVFRASAAMLMMIVGGIWISSIFLTAIKDYKRVLLGFAVGSLVSFFAAGIGGRWYQLNGAMVGFVFGHAVLLLLLFSAIYRQVGNKEVGTPDFLKQLRKYWPLAICGLAYNLGIWIDKFLFWWVDLSAVQVSGILYAAPVYDRVVYFSFLTIVPGMAVFLLKLETDFSVANEAFFQHVLRKGTLEQIAEKKQEMIYALQEGLKLLLKVQGMFTAVLILSADKVLYFLGMGAVQTSIFQIALLGTLLLVIFMSLLMILHYLDKGRDAMICCVTFALSNGLITWISMLAGERWYGVGFMIAACISMIMAAVLVNHHVRNLEYDTFTPQPLYP
ncbi:MAG: exopolysaccharide Pel transporter PelG [Limisphaerales bacterium]